MVVVMLSEISQIEKDKYSVCTYMWNIKNRSKCTWQNRNKLTDTEKKLVVISGEKKAGRVRGWHGTKKYTLLVSC